VPGALAALAIVACLVLGYRARGMTDALRPGRIGALLSGGRLVGGGVRDGLVMLRRPDPRVLGALAWWAFDAGVLWAMLHAFGAPPSLAVVALAYFVGQAGNTLPIPGAVSGGIVGVLVAFGVGADVALASVLAYRSVAIWLPAGIGLATIPSLRATLARWKAEDEVLGSAEQWQDGAERRAAGPCRPSAPVSREPIAA